MITATLPFKSSTVSCLSGSYCLVGLLVVCEKASLERTSLQVCIASSRLRLLTSTAPVSISVLGIDSVESALLHPPEGGLRNRSEVAHLDELTQPTVTADYRLDRGNNS